MGPERTEELGSLWIWGVSFIIASLIDYGTTEYLIGLGFTELNPLMKPYIGTPWFLVWKSVIPIAIVGYILWDGDYLAGLALKIGTYLTWVVVCWNSINILVEAI